MLRRHSNRRASVSQEENESPEHGGEGARRIRNVEVLICLSILAAFVIAKQGAIVRTRNEVTPTKDANEKWKSLLMQSVWNGTEIVDLLDAPDCAAAIRRAKQRQPPIVALCPLCTRGTLNSTHVQYLKVSKAGSSTMVKLLTHQDQSSSPLARHLCQGQPQDDFRFTLVRDPIDRVISAYREVDIGQWKNSPHISYRKHHTEPDRIVAFLEDFFAGNMFSFDCGMPHHLFSAALTLDAARSMNRLPNLVGRLENMSDFFTALNDKVGADLPIPNATYARGPKSIPGASNVIYSLFEEDFVCFGYQFIKNASAIELSPKKMRAYHRNHKAKIATPNCNIRYTLEPSE